MKECSAFVAHHKIAHLCRHHTFSISFVILFICISMGIGCSKTQETDKQPLSSESQQASQLTERLLYSNEDTKTAARKYLSTLDDASKSKLVPELVNALRHFPVLQYKQASDPNKVVARYRAAETLGILGPIAKDAAADLIYAMKNDDSDLVRNRATAALAKIGLDTDKVVPVLIDALSYSPEATNALSELGPKAVPALIIALKDSSVQSGAAIALAKMGPSARDASPALLEAMKTAKNDRLKKVFLDALEKIGPADAADLSALVQDLINSDNNIRFKAIDALAVKGKQVTPAIVKVLGGSSVETRFWAAYILGRNRADTKEALAALTSFLKDESILVRGNAIWALREINPRDFLSKDIQDDELAAIDYILNMKPKDDDIMIQTIYRLGEIINTYPQSPKLDQVYFKSGLAKIAIGTLIGETGAKSVLIKEYQENHKDDYFSFLGTMYTGGDLKTLVKKYPNSPLAPEAAYLIVAEQGNVGECEADVDCYLNGSIGTFLPFIKSYPTHSRIPGIINNINDSLQYIIHDPANGGVWEIFDIEKTTPLLKDYYSALSAIPNIDLRGEALYHLARGFISVGQYELADRIYNDLEANYPQYHNARIRAAYLLFDYSEEIPSGAKVPSKEVAQYTDPLSATSESVRLGALDKIQHAKISGRPLLFSLLLAVGNVAEKDNSAAVRRRAIDLIGVFASQTSFFRSAVGYCLLYDPDKQNQDYCAELGVNHSALKSTEFYTYNRERVNATISEATGKTYPSREMVAEWQKQAIQRDLLAAQEIAARAEAQGINIFGTKFVIVRNKFRPEIVIPLWLVMMTLCGLLNYRIARQRSADIRFWTILGALTAPISLIFVFFIPRKNVL